MPSLCVRCPCLKQKEVTSKLDLTIISLSTHTFATKRLGFEILMIADVSKVDIDGCVKCHHYSMLLEVNCQQVLRG